MRFVLMLKIDALGWSQEHHSADVTLGPLQDVFGTLLQRSKDVTLRTSFRDVFRMSSGRFAKTIRIYSSQLLSISRKTFS